MKKYLLFLIFIFIHYLTFSQGNVYFSVPPDQCYDYDEVFVVIDSKVYHGYYTWAKLTNIFLSLIHISEPTRPY